MKQPFAVETSIIAALSDTRQFNQDMRSFVGMIGRDWSWDMATWARAEMTDESVYQVRAPSHHSERAGQQSLHHCGRT